MAVGGDRAIRRGHMTALDGKPHGTALIEQDDAARTAGSGLGQGRAGARAGKEARETRDRPRGRGPQVPEALPGEPERHAQPRLPEDSCAARRRRDSARDTAKPQNRARETAANEHGRTPQTKHGRRQQRTRRRRTRRTQEEGGQGPQAETLIQGQESPEGPQAASKPEFAERGVSRFPG